MAEPTLWAIAIVLIGMLSGPQIHVVEGSTFNNKAACEAGIAASVPAKLEPDAKKEWEAGYRQYVCVRVHGVPG
ncbi:MAG: hypothetical protein WDN08_01890 [Rhizomicrobium sp.]